MRAMQDSLDGLETQGQVGREGHAGQPGRLRDRQEQVTSAAFAALEMHRNVCVPTPFPVRLEALAENGIIRSWRPLKYSFAPCQNKRPNPLAEWYFKKSYFPALFKLVQGEAVFFLK